METCPKCKSAHICKNGIVKQKQRYLCKKCKYCFTVEHIGKPDRYKRDALILYLEGLGFRSIGRFLKVSHVTVFNWIKKFEKQLDEIRSSDDIEVVEIDEMHTYIGSKKNFVGYHFIRSAHSKLLKLFKFQNGLLLIEIISLTLFIQSFLLQMYFVVQ